MSDQTGRAPKCEDNPKAGLKPPETPSASQLTVSALRHYDGVGVLARMQAQGLEGGRFGCWHVGLVNGRKGLRRVLPQIGWER